MEDGWTKYFIDGTRYFGYDKDPKRTWRNSRNTGILRTECCWRNRPISITGIGEFWQSDDMESVMSLGVKQPSKILARRISKLMTEQDDIIQVVDSDTYCHAVFLPTNLVPPQKFVRAKPGQWFVVELISTKNGGTAIIYYMSKERI